MNALSTALLLMTGIVAIPAAHAQRTILDDSLSPRQNYSVELNWGPQDIEQAMGALFAEQDTALPPLTGYLSAVEIRLDTSRFVGKRARIFMSVPGAIAGDNSGGTLELAWQGRGAFESGSMRPGQAVLIFEGALDSPVLTGTFDFAISIASAGTTDSFNFELMYEIEIIN